MKTWMVTYKDGRKLNGTNHSWSDVDLEQVVGLELIGTLQGESMLKMPEGCIEYRQSKTASCNMDGSSVDVEAYNLGAKISSNGHNDWLIVRENAKTGDIKITLEDAF